LDYASLIWAFAALWLTQSIFAFIQSRSMSRKILELQAAHRVGHMGIGLSRAKFNAGKGIILTVITDMDGRIAEFQLLSGYTVMARFKSIPKYIGLMPHEVVASMTSKKDKRLSFAFIQAIEKINGERLKQGLLQLIV
jgi:glucitol operon activator protein